MLLRLTQHHHELKSLEVERSDSKTITREKKKKKKERKSSDCFHLQAMVAKGFAVKC